MEMQNITLSLPRDVLRKVKILAVQRGTSISRLLTNELERLLEQEELYARAMQRHMHLMEQGIDLGTQGQIHTSRDELHERN
jgi:hypothetical protein